MDSKFDVAIVGYGPTGMAAASLLGRLGHRVLVIERWPALYGLPRLTHIDDETARTIQAAADIDDALRDSTPTEYLWVNGKGETLLVLPTHDGQMGYPAHISMYQPDIENAIHSRLGDMPNVEVRQGWALAEMHQDADEVIMTIAPWDGDSIATDGRQTVRADYVIGADGSKSMVRELLGIVRDDLGFNEQWVNVDTEWLGEHSPEFSTSKQYCDPARGHMYMNIGTKRQRFEYAVIESDDPTELGSEASAWDFLKRTHNLGPKDVRIVRRLVYTFEARIAQQWSKGRVFLAGDSAHTMPPYLGQGACSGIRDSTNLAWKLHLVLTGAAAPSLLDSYELERKPHATIITQMAIGLGHIANMRDAIEAEHRDAAFKAGQVPPPPPLPTIVAGVLQGGQTGAVAAAIGALTPQGRLGSAGTTMRGDDVLGYGFALISRSDVATSLSDEQRAVLEAVGCALLPLDGPIIDVDGTYRVFLESLGAEAALVRPDFALFGTAASPAGIGELVDELAAALSLTPSTAAR